MATYDLMNPNKFLTIFDLDFDAKKAVLMAKYSSRIETELAPEDEHYLLNTI